MEHLGKHSKRRTFPRKPGKLHAQVYNEAFREVCDPSTLRANYYRVDYSVENRRGSVSVVDARTFLYYLLYYFRRDGGGAENKHVSPTRR